MSMIGIIILYLLLGALAGTMAGLFGIGGGLVIVPVLIFSFGLQGISPEIAAHLAVGTSLATIVFTSISSIRTHHQHG
ncbi:MAG: TSUP family transporter, partial [Pseudomonadota bacterium]|nr:TSUP family transporter [Pseudomonadota bacterium]